MKAGKPSISIPGGYAQCCRQQDARPARDDRLPSVRLDEVHQGSGVSLRARDPQCWEGPEYPRRTPSGTGLRSAHHRRTVFDVSLTSRLLQVGLQRHRPVRLTRSGTARNHAI